MAKKPGLIARALKRYRKNRKLRSRKPSPSSKPKPGFVKKLAGAAAGHALKDAVYIGKHVSKVFEDGMGGVGGTPVNNASSGAVAGLGTWKDGSQGEPGIDNRNRKKYKSSPALLTYKEFQRKKPT